MGRMRIDANKRMARPRARLLDELAEVVCGLFVRFGGKWKSMVRCGVA